MTFQSLAVVAATIPCLGVAAPATTVAEALGPLLPRSGAWTAVFTIDNPMSQGVWQVAYDWETASWSLVAPHISLGSNPTFGPFIIAREPPGPPTGFDTPIRTRPGRTLPGEDMGIDPYFPTVLLRDLVDREHDVAEVSPRQGGGWLVRVRWIGGGRNANLAVGRNDLIPEEVTLEFDAQGRLVRRQQGWEHNNVQTWEFEYDHRSPPGFAVPSRVKRSNARQGAADDLVLVRVSTLNPQEFASTFEPESVRRAAVELGREAAEGALRPSIGANPLSQGAAQPSSPTNAREALVPGPQRDTRTSWERFRWPLVLTGLITIAIGVVAWWRRARA